MNPMVFEVPWYLSLRAFSHRPSIRQRTFTSRENRTDPFSRLRSGQSRFPPNVLHASSTSGARCQRLGRAGPAPSRRTDFRGIIFAFPVADLQRQGEWNVSSASTRSTISEDRSAFRFPPCNRRWGFACDAEARIEYMKSLQRTDRVRPRSEWLPLRKTAARVPRYELRACGQRRRGVRAPQHAHVLAELQPASRAPRRRHCRWRQALHARRDRWGSRRPGCSREERVHAEERVPSPALNHRPQLVARTRARSSEW